MKYATLLVLTCTLWGSSGYPYRFYGNRDTISYGASDSHYGGMVLSRYYNPDYNSRTPIDSGNAAFLYKPEEQNQHASQYFQPDRRRQTAPEAYGQQSGVYYPQAPETAIAPEPTELSEPIPTEKVEIPTTVKAIALPELTEPDVEEVEEPKETKEIAPVPKKRVTKKKQIKSLADDEDEDEENSPKIPNGAFFPMFFGWGGRSSGGAPKGATAIANAFSTGRGAAANSHAVAYGQPRPETKLN